MTSSDLIVLRKMLVIASADLFCIGLLDGLRCPPDSRSEAHADAGPNAGSKSRGECSVGSQLLGNASLVD